MTIKGLVDEDFVNYKEISMFIIFPTCSFKCDRENNCRMCQNSNLVKSQDYDMGIEEIVERYMSNPISKAIVCGGLEPFDSEQELQNLIEKFRQVADDVFVIYTGYTEKEVAEKYNWVYNYNNLIIKFGRFRPNQVPHFDEVLGVSLVNDEQYAKKIG